MLPVRPLEELHPRLGRRVQDQAHQPPYHVEHLVDGRNHHPADRVGVVVHDDGGKRAQHRWVLVAEAAADPVHQHQHLVVGVPDAGPLALVHEEAHPAVRGDVGGVVDGAAVEQRGAPALEVGPLRQPVDLVRLVGKEGVNRRVLLVQDASHAVLLAPHGGTEQLVGRPAALPPVAPHVPEQVYGGQGVDPRLVHPQPLRVAQRQDPVPDDPHGLRLSPGCPPVLPKPRSREVLRPELPQRRRLPRELRLLGVGELLRRLWNQGEARHGAKKPCRRAYGGPEHRHEQPEDHRRGGHAPEPLAGQPVVEGEEPVLEARHEGSPGSKHPETPLHLRHIPHRPRGEAGGGAGAERREFSGGGGGQRGGRGVERPDVLKGRPRAGSGAEGHRGKGGGKGG
mmetsp:Transcript_16322/g.41176  ORF Transcript_16322/g.41176 Transcript_16322/m.41176 type:complete len:396 (-) Transcript_16322:148-1335(-)